MSAEGMGVVITIAGLVVAVGIFVLAAWFVARARAGTRRLRQRRHDPHAPTARQQRAHRGRDIDQ
jgi:hypothetical protein